MECDFVLNKINRKARMFDLPGIPGCSKQDSCYLAEVLRFTEVPPHWRLCRLLPRVSPSLLGKAAVVNAFYENAPSLSLGSIESCFTEYYLIYIKILGVDASEMG